MKGRDETRLMHPLLYHFVSKSREAQEMKCVSGSVQSSMPRSSYPREASHRERLVLAAYSPSVLDNHFLERRPKAEKRRPRASPHLARSSKDFEGAESNCRHQPFESCAPQMEPMAIRR